MSLKDFMDPTQRFRNSPDALWGLCDLQDFLRETFVPFLLTLNTLSCLYQTPLSSLFL